MKEFERVLPHPVCVRICSCDNLAKGSMIDHSNERVFFIVFPVDFSTS